MADRPPRRLPPSVQQLVSVFERDTDVGSEQAAMEARNVGYQLNSEVVTETISDVSDHSMTAEELDDDDLLDSEEEYMKEMEEERLADMKNGHFEEGFRPPILPTASSEEAAAFIAASFYAPTMSLDTFMDEGNGHSHGIPAMGGNASSMSGGAGDCSNVSEQSLCMGRVAGSAASMSLDRLVGEGKGHTHWKQGMGGVVPLTDGGCSIVSEELVQPPVENCGAAESSMHASMYICMGNVEELNAKAAYSLRSTKIQDNNSTFLGMECRLPTVRVDGECDAHLDLVETRSLVEQNFTLDHQNGLCRARLVTLLGLLQFRYFRPIHTYPPSPIQAPLPLSFLLSKPPSSPSSHTLQPLSQPSSPFSHHPQPKLFPNPIQAPWPSGKGCWIPRPSWRSRVRTLGGVICLSSLL